MKEILKFLRPYKWGFFWATLAVTAATVCDLLLPTLMSDILNNGVYGGDLGYILSRCLVMLLVAGAGLTAVLVGSRISNRVVSNFCRDIRGAVFRKVHTMSFEEYSSLGTAALVTRATHDVETVSWIASELCGTVITIPVLFFGGVILAMGKDLLLSLTMLAVLPVIFALVLILGKRIVPLWEKSDEYVDKQNAIMRARLRGIRVIRAFGAEDREHEKVASATRRMAHYIICSNVATSLIAPVAILLLNLAAVLILYLGGWRMETGSGITAGDLFAMVEYVALVSGGVVMGAFTILSFPQAKVAAGRIAQVLRSKGMADPVAREERRFSGEITFQNVTFSYGTGEPALRDVNFHIVPGQKVAIIGGTGAGKSTVVSMLMGFRTPTSGEVLLDGIPTTALSRHTMRENMSCVLQNATIYSGTIRENLKMGREEAEEAQLLRALEIAQGREMVEGFAQGLDHEIRQSGKNLSGGQKQRLSIARALLKDVPIYIFDDSFSALDFLTEARLRRALGAYIADRTQIIVTQRVTSAMHCDCILVMDQGALVDSGTHEELLQRCKVYGEIYASQTGGGAV